MQETSPASPSPQRIGFVAVLAIAVLVQLGYTASRPIVDKDKPPETKAVNYPTDVPLGDWKLESSQAIAAPHALISPGQKYQYRRGSETLTAQTHLEVNKAGAVNHYLMLLGVPVGPTNLEIKTDPDRGTYAIVKRDDKTYLGACLNAAGKSTFEQGELTANRYKYGITPLGVMGWLMGFNDLTDNRCLLTVLSVPAPIPDEVTHQRNAQTLTTAWLAWYDWWKPQLQTAAFK